MGEINTDGMYFPDLSKLIPKKKIPHNRGGKGILTPLRENILRGGNQVMPTKHRDNRCPARADNQNVRG